MKLVGSSHSHEFALSFVGTEDECTEMRAAVVLAMLEIKKRAPRRRPCGCKG